jgi:hypothetical protein
VALGARSYSWKVIHHMWLTGRLRLGRSTACLLGLLSVAIFAVPLAPHAQSNDQTGSRIGVRTPPIHATPIQVNVDLVLLNVTVTDLYDRIVTGLEPSNFQVFDDKVVHRERHQASGEGS